jgi:hypothetical protein
MSNKLNQMSNKLNQMSNKLNQMSNKLNQKFDKNFDKLCNQLDKLSIEQTEYDLLYNAVYEISEIEKRYQRYIKCITIWEINEISYESIRDDIAYWLFTPTTTENKKYKILFAIAIDDKLKSVLKKYY